MIALAIPFILIGALIIWVPIHKALVRRRENQRLAQAMPSYHGANRSQAQREEIRRRIP